MRQEEQIISAATVAKHALIGHQFDQSERQRGTDDGADHALQDALIAAACASDHITTITVTVTQVGWTRSMLRPIT